MSTFCPYGAPLVAIETEEHCVIKQGCCNHWDCPVCSNILAGYHAHRMQEGARILSETGTLWFWTTTCRGRDLDLETADDNYLLWTNRLLAACRARAKKQGVDFQYVQVTERQKRGAAHSHYISTFCPDDAIHAPVPDDQHRYVSDWFVKRNVSAGLGPQCRISAVQTPERAAGYIAKYLKKQLKEHEWPKHWKRIRYSQKWPDCALIPDYAQSLHNRQQWTRLDERRNWYETTEEIHYQYARRRMFFVQPPKPVDEG